MKVPKLIILSTIAANLLFLGCSPDSHIATVDETSAAIFNGSLEAMRARLPVSEARMFDAGLEALAFEGRGHGQMTDMTAHDIVDKGLDSTEKSRRRMLDSDTESLALAEMRLSKFVEFDKQTEGEPTQEEASRWKDAQSSRDEIAAELAKAQGKLDELATLRRTIEERRAGGD